MRRFLRIKLFIALLILLSSCTSGGSGGGGSSGSGGSTGGVGTTGGSSSGGSSTGGSTGGDVGGSSTGGVTGGISGGGGGGGSSSGGGGGGANTTTGSVSINAISGRSSVQYSIPLNSGSGVRGLDLTLNISNANVFQNVGTYPGVFIVTTSLNDPSATLVVPGPSNLLTTFALIPASSVNTLNYPTRSADPAVVSGGYLQKLLYDAGGPTNATGIVLAKNDSNLDSGSFNLNIFLVGTEVQKTSNRQVIQEAIIAFKSIYAAIGVSVSEQYTDVNSSFGVLPNPISGSSFYTSQGNAARSLSVNMFIGETISSDGTQSPGNELTGVVGITSAIPGAAIPTDFSAVAISLSQHQGPDGAFNQEEKSVFAETMAHECGHYLGLFHPVEASFDEFDPLDDTPTCTSGSQCVSNGVAANLMYPTVVNGIIQRNLTNDQRGVVNRNVLLD